MGLAEAERAAYERMHREISEERRLRSVVEDFARTVRETVDTDNADTIAYAHQHATAVTEAWRVQNTTLREQLVNEQQNVADIKLKAQAFADGLKAETDEAGKMTNVAMSLLRDRILALQATDANLRGEVSRLRQASVSQCEQLAVANESLRVAREGSLHVRSPDVLT